MGRIRTIKPDFWKHEDLSALPEATHLLAAALLNYADDSGYFNANVGLIKAECSPLREPSVSIQDSLKSLVGIGYIQIFFGKDGKSYGRIVKFDEHQRVNRPTASKIKGLCVEPDHSWSAHTQFSEPSPPEGKRKGREKEGKSNAPKGALVRAAVSRETPSADDLNVKPTQMTDAFDPPGEWIAEAMRKGKLTQEEAEDEWLEFKGYWLERAGKKDGSKKNWLRTWVNYVTGDICQRRVTARRRNTGPAASTGITGTVERLRRSGPPDDCDARGKPVSDPSGEPERSAESLGGGADVVALAALGSSRW